MFDLNTRSGFRDRWNNITVMEREEDLVVLRGVYDGVQDRAVMRISGFTRMEGSWQRFEETVTETVFSVRDVLELLRESGFSQAWPAVLADLRTPLQDPEAADRVFLVALAGGGQGTRT